MDDATSKVGSVVGDRYRIDREIGRGGMGVVYRATRLSDNETVALKMLLGDRQTAKQRARFAREIGLAAQMRHPNSLRVLEGGHTPDGAPFLAFELLEGRTLQDAIAQRGSFALERVVGVGLQVLGALEEAHRLSIIHRDIKPANIFLCPHPTPDFVKVLDFGVAKQEGDMQSALTSAGAMVGTPHYMPPEQLGGGQVGPPSDLYALGLVLAEMLHGRRIVDDETLLSVYLTQASPEPLALPATVTGTVLGPVVVRATAKDPGLRYPTAAAMREALLATGVVPFGVAEGPPPAAAGFLRSQVWLAAAVAFLLGASVVSFTVRGVSARRDRVTEPVSKTKSKTTSKPASGKPSQGRVGLRLDRVTPAKIERALAKAGYEARLTSEVGKNHVWMAYDGDDPQGSITFFDTDEVSAMILADMCNDGPATFAQDGGRVLCVELDRDAGEERALFDAITK